MRHVIVLMSILLSVPLAAHASWDDPLGLKAAAEVAGAKAGAEAAEGMVKASRNITMMTNQFGQILSDYYGDDAAKKESARRLIEGAFKVDLSKTNKFSVEVTAAFENTSPTKPIRADILFLNDEVDSQIQGILKTSTRFKGEEINAPIIASTTVEDAKTQIRSLLENRINNTTGCPKPIIRHGSTYGGAPIDYVANAEEIGKCVQSNETSALVNAILTTVSYTKTIPSKTSFSRQYTGGKYAVLVIPVEDLNSAPNNLNIDIIMHEQGDTSKPLTVFKRSPKKVDVNYMKTHIAKTDNATYGAFYYFYVDLRLEGIAAAPIAWEQDKGK